MNERPDIDRVLRHWFADGPSEMPDRVVETVADRISRQRQRRAWRLPWRPSDMNSTIKIGAAIAAVLVLAIVGLEPPAWPVDGGGRPAQSLGVTIADRLADTSPSPTPRSARMVVQQKPISWTADLPANWANNGWFTTPSQGPAGPTGIAVGTPVRSTSPATRATGSARSRTPRRPPMSSRRWNRVTDLVVSNAIDTTLGGYPAMRVDIQAPADLSACGEDLYIIMAEPGGAGFHVQGPSQKIRMWIVDVDGQPTVFQINSFAVTPADDLAAAEQIVDSIVITP